MKTIRPKQQSFARRLSVLAFVALNIPWIASGDRWSGNGLGFNGVDQAVVVPGFGANLPTTEITIEFWQRAFGTADQYSLSLSPVVQSSLCDVSAPWRDGRVYFEFGNNQPGEGALSYLPQESIIGTWQHFACVASQSGNYMRIYRNGVIEAQKTGMVPFTGGNFDLMLGGIPNLDGFNGQLDEVRIWNVARTQSQIQANMNQPLNGPQPGLVGYWQFDEVEGTYAADSSGNDHTGILTNGPARAPSYIPTVTVVGFDDLPDGTLVTNQYQYLAGQTSTNISCTNVGFYFLSQDYCGCQDWACGCNQNGTLPCHPPVVFQVPSGEAQSGAHVLSIVVPNGCLGEAVSARSFARGRLVTTASRIALYAGVFDGFSGTTITLSAYNATNGLVGQASAVLNPGAGFHTLLEVTSASANIASFAIEQPVASPGTGVGIDDLNFTIPAIPPPPDFYLGLVPLGPLDHIVAGWTSYSVQIDDFGLNCSQGQVGLNVTGPLPTGVSYSFNNGPLNQGVTISQSSLSTATLTFTASAQARPTGYPGALVTITATPGGNPGAGPAARSIQTRLVVSEPFTISIPPSVTLFDCVTASVPVTIQADYQFQGQVNLSVSGLPNGIQADFEPPSVTLSTANSQSASSSLKLHVNGPFQLGGLMTVRATTGSQSSSATAQFHTSAGGINSATTIFGSVGYTPGALHSGVPGSEVVIQGTGFGTDTNAITVKFINETLGKGPFATATPFFVSADGTQIKVLIPRLAQSGHVAVSLAGGCDYLSSDWLEIRTFRNTFGFPFSNHNLSVQASGYGMDDFQELYGWDALAEHDPIFGLPLPIPNWGAVTLLAIMNGAGEKASGNCTGFCLSGQQITLGTKSLYDFAPFKGCPGQCAPSADIWHLVGPDPGDCNDRPAPDDGSGPERDIRHFIHVQQLSIVSDEFLDHYLNQSHEHCSKHSSDIYNELVQVMNGPRGTEPTLVIGDPANGFQVHSVTAYDLEATNGTSDFYIYTYNNNVPYSCTEYYDPSSHEEPEVGTDSSVIHVTADDRYEGDGFSGTFDNFIIMPYGTVPEDPHILNSERISRLILVGSATTAQVTNSQGNFMLRPDGTLNTDPATAFPLATRLPYVGGQQAAFDGFVISGTNAFNHLVRGATNGAYSATYLLKNFGVQLANVAATSNSSDNIQFDPSGSVVFQTSDATKPLAAQVMARTSNNVERIVSLNTTAFQNGQDGLAFGASRDQFTYTHLGPATSFSLSLVQLNTNNQREFFFIQTQPVANGDAVTITPSDWYHLNTATAFLSIVHTNGTTNQVNILSAQGQVNFNNNVAGSLVAPIYGVDPANPSLSKTGNTPSGTPAGTQTYGGALLAGTNFVAQLYGGLPNTPDGLLQPLSAPVDFGVGAATGFVLSPGVVSIACAAPGQSARLQLRVWDTRDGAHPTYESALGDPQAARGVSSSFDSLPMGGGAFAVPDLAGLTSFNVWLPGTNANAWTGTASGKWETSSEWQQGTPSLAQSGILINNPGSKSIVLDSNTVTYFPTSMTVSNIALIGNSGAVNTLVLRQAGTNTPLNVLGEVNVGSNGSIRIEESSLRIDPPPGTYGLSLSGGELEIDSGSLLFPTSASAAVGLAGNGIVTVNGGTVQAGEIDLGAGPSATGTLVLTGGTLYDPYGVIYLAPGLGATGILVITGGNFLMTGSDLFLGLYGTGQFTMLDGTAQIPGLHLGNAGGTIGTLTMSGGSLAVTRRALTVGSLEGDTAPCTVDLSGGNLIVSNAAQNAGTLVSKGVVSLSGGTLQTDVLIATNAQAAVQFMSGVLTTSGSAIANGASFTIGDGVRSAQMNLPAGTHFFANGLVVSPNASLVIGCATLNAAIINGGSVTVGCTNGTVLINGPFTNNGTLTVSNGAALVFNGLVVNNSTIGADASSSVQFNGGMIDNGTVSGTVSGPAVIVTQPQSQAVDQWGSAILSVLAGGSAPFSYQWGHSGTNLPGATTSSYVISNALPANAGSYQVLVSNTYGGVLSDPATLAVTPPPPTTTAGTKLLVNGMVVLLDDFESALAGDSPTATFGSWQNLSTGVVVTNADFPGAQHGNQYLQFENTGSGASLGAVLGLPAANSGDLLQFDTMAYVSPLAYGIPAPLQFLACTTGGINSQARLDAWIGQDGTVYYYPGYGTGVASSTHIKYGKWQHWEISHVVGSYLWSWYVDGQGDSSLGVNQSVPDPAIRSVQLVATTNAPGIALYLDGMPDLTLLNPRVNQGIFSFDFNTVPGKFYQIQYKTDLGSPAWITNPSILAGDGTIQTFNEPVAASERMYRVILY
jgi:hypothetical protein